MTDQAGPRTDQPRTRSGHRGRSQTVSIAMSVLSAEKPGASHAPRSERDFATRNSVTLLELCLKTEGHIRLFFHTGCTLTWDFMLLHMAVI